MKHIFQLISISISLMLFSNFIFAQQDCENPHLIPSIPFSATGLSTVGMGNLFDANDLCGSNAMVNEEYIFQFTPETDMQINIALTNTQVITSSLPIASANIGLFLTDKCPDEAAGNCIAFVDNASSNPAINNINVNQGQTYFIIVSSADMLFLGSTNVNFDINITRNLAYDLELKSISLPGSACDLGEEQIFCLIKNRGEFDVTEFELVYYVNGGSPVFENYSGLISPDSEITYEFENLISFSDFGEYNIEITINYGLDEYIGNNTLSASTYFLPTYNTFPLIEDFEDNFGFWSSGGTSSSWVYGNPSASTENPVINSAASGDFCWVTNLNGNANTSENSYIESPCYDLSGLFQPRLELKYWADFSLYGNSAKIKASVDGGETWNLTIAELSSTDTWKNLVVSMPDLIDETNVRFRITFEGGYLVANGLAIDDFTIKESVLKDVGVSNIITPNTGCGLTDIETVRIEVKNYGVQTANNIPVNYSIDGGETWLASDEVIASIVAGGAVQHFFNITGDFSEIGEYEIIAKTNLEGDEDIENDSFTKIVLKQNTILVENSYSESFEDGDGGWMAYGTNSSLELAEPNYTIINHAGDGDYAWVTNATGPHNQSEVSYLESPCFDLSDMVNPKFKAMVQYETTPLMSNFLVEYSFDGMAWDTVRAGSISNGWYGEDLLSFGTWGGSSEGWQEVSTEIGFMAGQSSVKFRFVFDTGLISFPIGDEETEGVAIDFVRIEDCDILPEAQFSFTTNQLQANFTDESTNAASWTWDFGDNEFLPSTSNEQNPSFTYNQEGQYYVTLIVTNMCGSSIAGEWVNVSTTGINNDIDNQIKIYPNPTNKFINIDNIQNSEINIYDINGKLIYKQFINENKLVLDIKDWANGIYFIKTQSDTKSFIKK